MVPDFGYLLVSRNNSPMISEWAKKNVLRDRFVMNIDESTSPEQKTLCQEQCLRFGIHYEQAEPGGLVRNLKQAARYFRSRQISFILYMHHDAYPEDSSTIERVSRLVTNNDLSSHGLFGFNVIHGSEAVQNQLSKNRALHTLARSPLEKGDGWYRPLPTSRLNYRLTKNIPFAVESVMWSTVLLSCRLIEEDLEEDSRFVFFHAMDDVAFQLLLKGKFNIVVPFITFMHNQMSKVRHGLPENSPISQSGSKEINYYYGRNDHLNHWQEKWLFRWDFRKVIQTTLFSDSFQPKVNRVFGRIHRQFNIDPLIGFQTIARSDFASHRDYYKDSLLDEFYKHDPKNGPIHYFPKITA
jgi:hypothetical protein